ncbi:hypothetical protein BC832DRAFT_595888 [Gaertneriomyces semiglobifer]|nr:hypothetical protein BC832DRAFT_595888 [Gaertneriomyces semiglobifer]
MSTDNVVVSVPTNSRKRDHQAVETTPPQAKKQRGRPAKQYLNFDLTREEIAKVFNDGRKPGTKAYDPSQKEVKAVFSLFGDKKNIKKNFDKPEKIVAAVASWKLNEDVKGQYLSSIARFYRLQGSQLMCLDDGTLETLTRALYAAMKSKRKPAEDRRLTGEPSPREQNRDVHVEFPEMKESAQKNWEDHASSLLAATRRLTKTQYHILLRGLLLCIYTLMPNIRSKWVDIKESPFDVYTEDGFFVAGNRKFLIFNTNRKRQSGSYVQDIPQDLSGILDRWRHFKKFCFPDGTNHVLVDFEGKQLTRRALRNHITEAWKCIRQQPIGISDMRRSHITHLIETVRNTGELTRYASDFHHTKAEFDLYFRVMKIKSTAEDWNEEESTEDASEPEESDNDEVIVVD